MLSGSDSRNKPEEKTIKKNHKSEVVDGTVDRNNRGNSLGEIMTKFIFFAVSDHAQFLYRKQKNNKKLFY